ncbi:MAG: hypothetical protein ACKVWV_05960 [Planctomycetota bacterium]
MRQQLALLGRLAHVAAGVVIASEIGSAQCLEWQTGFGGAPLSGTVYAQTVFDDGSGPALYVGGLFKVAGSATVHNIGRWNGTDWSAVGGGLTGQAQFGDTVSQSVLALTVFDDGSGPALYAGGRFSSAGGVPVRNLARWDGSTWTDVGGGVGDSVGTGPAVAVRALAVHDDGSGPALYVGGRFREADALPARNIAKWDGATWTALGPGVQSVEISDERIFALTPFDDGSGSKLYVAGSFDRAGALVAKHVASWNGSSWSALSSGLEGSGAVSARALAVFDDDGPGGAAPRLYVGGQFNQAGGVGVSAIARWDGTAFVNPAGGVTVCEVPNGQTSCWPIVTALAALDDGSGAKLFVGGHFRQAGALAVQDVARWDGSAWSGMASGIAGLVAVDAPYITSFARFDEGVGPAVFVGGYFAFTGDGLRGDYLVRFRAGAWSSLMTSGNGVDGIVYALSRFDDGSGSALYVGGGFESAGDVAARNVARWDGTSWSSVGAGLNGVVRTLAALPTGAAGCAELYAGGSFTIEPDLRPGGVAKWNGSTWEYLTSGLDDSGVAGSVIAIAAYDDGLSVDPTIYAGGIITSAGGAPAGNLVRWNGTSWTHAGSIAGQVNALAVFDDGGGERLWVGGAFSSVSDGVNGTQSIVNIAKWSGSGGYEPAVSLADDVYALLVWDDGTGEALYAGGRLTPSDAVVPRVVKWTGSAWTGVGALSGRVRALSAFDDGSGQESLYAGGETGLVFLFVPPPPNLLRWDGAAWQVVGGGVYAQTTGDGPIVAALESFQSDPSRGPDLCVGGKLQRVSAAELVSSHFAVWKGCGVPPGTRFCFGDGSLSTPCPCAPPDFVPNPPAAIGHGCANSFNLDGALLSGSGSTSANDVVLTGTGQSPIGFSFFFVGTSEVTSGIAVADGVRCASGALTRFGSQNAVCGSVKYPNPDVGWTSPLSTVSGTTPGSGLTKYYQVYYRNAAAGFCTSGTANFTSGYRVTW